MTRAIKGPRHSVVSIMSGLLLLRRHYSPMRTFASLMALSQSALFFYLSFQLLLLHFLMSVCTPLIAPALYNVRTFHVAILNSLIHNEWTTS
jgi:hypothetical protein